LVGLSLTKEKYNSLAHNSKTNIVDVLKEESNNFKKKLTDIKLDSIKKNLEHDIENSFIPIPEIARKQILSELEKEAKDTTATALKDKGFNINFGANNTLDKFIKYQKRYPDSNIDTALDSLEYEKNFTNRFLYTRAKAANSFTESKESRNQFLNQILSYGSISLFILLPFFTLFLKLYYIRRKYTFVDHLIFVFHLQTVFFLLLSLYYILKICNISPQLWVFATLFLLYLLISMKNFYQQGYIKTFLKFLFLNLSYIIVASIGVIFVLIITFAMF